MRFLGALDIVPMSELFLGHLQRREKKKMSNITALCLRWLKTPWMSKLRKTYALTGKSATEWEFSSDLPVWHKHAWCHSSTKARVSLSIIFYLKELDFTWGSRRVVKMVDFTDVLRLFREIIFMRIIFYIGVYSKYKKKTGCRKDIVIYFMKKPYHIEKPI